MSEWEFVDQRIDNSQLDLKHGLIIEDENGNDFTDEIIENQGYQFILTSYDLDDAAGQGMIEAGILFNKLMDSDISFVLLTPSLDVIDKYRDEYNINYDVYPADDIELKAMIRSNPGLVLLKNGIVIEKWHHNDFPTIDKVNELITK